MGKYGNIVGKYEFNIGGLELEIEPLVGDGRKFLKLVSKANEDKGLLFDNFFGFVKELISRKLPPENNEEIKELELYVDTNLLSLLNEMMVAFGMTTKEELEQQKKDMLQVITKRE